MVRVFFHSNYLVEGEKTHGSALPDPLDIIKRSHKEIIFNNFPLHTAHKASIMHQTNICCLCIRKILKCVCTHYSEKQKRN